MTEAGTMERPPAWVPDKQLPGFEAATLEFPPDYDGPVVATLVRKTGVRAHKRAVLYVHGFIDYFFQAHMAERFESEGWSFYALDLRKHGRSLLPQQHPCFCKRIDEYFPDITRAIGVIRGEIDGPLLLAGHSTGGLVTALFASSGEAKEEVSALWLNSPFFDFKVPRADRFKLGIAAATGLLFPFLTDPKGLPRDYVKSIHQTHGGEWAFDLKLKPLDGFPLYFGWIGAILAAHAKVHAGLSLKCPVLVMHSDEADIVLDWRDIAKWSPGLGTHVTVQQYPGGLHDLALSKHAIRENVFSALFAWLAPAKA
jgi:alpha-beta hydrolase superfamily lysophospholipase